MVGTDLNTREMTDVVRRLEGVEQPWNCPHGRPTMRHLAALGPSRAPYTVLTSMVDV